jgi:hypothetical protein
MRSLEPRLPGVCVLSDAPEGDAAADAAARGASSGVSLRLDATHCYLYAGWLAYLVLEVCGLVSLLTDDVYS